MVLLVLPSKNLVRNKRKRGCIWQNNNRLLQSSSFFQVTLPQLEIAGILSCPIYLCLLNMKHSFGKEGSFLHVNKWSFCGMLWVPFSDTGYIAQTFLHKPLPRSCFHLATHTLDFAPILLMLFKQWDAKYIAEFNLSFPHRLLSFKRKTN